MLEKFQNFTKNLDFERILELDMSKLFEWEYLTDKTPRSSFVYEQWIYIIVLVNLFLSLFVFRYLSFSLFQSGPKYKLSRKISFLWFSNTIFLLLYTILRVEGVAFLSMRLWLVIIISGFGFMILYSIFFIIFKLPGKMREYKAAKIRDKYKR